MAFVIPQKVMGVGQYDIKYWSLCAHVWLESNPLDKSLHKHSGRVSFGSLAQTENNCIENTDLVAKNCTQYAMETRKLNKNKRNEERIASGLRPAVSRVPALSSWLRVWVSHSVSDNWFVSFNMFNMFGHKSDTYFAIYVA